MDKLRHNQKIIWNHKKDLEFQVLDWNSLDFMAEPDSDSEGEEEYVKRELKYIIRLFGVTKEGYSVCTTVTGFKPYFFISIPDNWKKTQVQLLVNTVTERLVKYNVTAPDFKIVKRHKFRGFTNNAKFRYVKLSFENTKSFNRFKDMFYTEINILGKKQKFDLFESKMDPMLRFIHINDLKAAGWVQIKKFKYEVNIEKISKCQIDVTVDWNDVKPFDSDTIAPLLIASFDIEADSSHGDFPLAKKTYKKLASDVLVHYWTSLANIAKYKNVKKQRDIWKRFVKHRLEREEAKKAKSKKIVINETFLDSQTDLFIKEKYQMVKRTQKMLENEDEYFYNLIASAFGLTPLVENINCVFTKKGLKPSKVTIKAIVNDIKYICHFKQMKIKGNNDLKKGVRTVINRMENCGTIKQVEYVINDVAKRNYLNPVHLQSKILVKDVLVDYIDMIMTKNFPAVEGDKVIQIGTVVQEYGNPEPIIKHIITLKGCEPIKGAVVVPCKTEKQVLMEWHKFITKLDPDIITGYNIFGFDEIFMYERSCELNCMETFNELGRIIGEEPKLEIKNLSSSALGDNVLNYIKTSGRVQIDIFKVVQRDHKLNSYKLDFVANNFVRGDMYQIGTNKKGLKLNTKEYKKYDTETGSKYIEIDSTKDLSVGNFIYLNPKNAVEQSLDGKKYKIKQIVELEYDDNDNSKDKIKAHGLILDNEVSYETTKDNDIKFCWGLAKDDVHHTDIFRLQKGSDADRKIIADYCIQDCALLIHLINKLCIITNNLGMANVCHVPFSYIFLRGQGIKLYSFVGKQCRLDDYLIPDLIKESDLEEKKNKLNNDRKGRFNKLLKDNDLIESMEIETIKYDLDDGGCYHIGYEDDDQQKGYIVKDDEDGYEGAIVIQPYPDIYFEPVSVTDYGSLYPSSMISENLSHDSIVFEAKYDNLPGYDYLDVTYEIKKSIDPTLKHAPKVTFGFKTCRFAQFPNNDKGIIPKVLQQLLKARKSTRVKQETENDKFKWDVLEGLQLAYKVTANSLYGQIGARTSPIYLKDIAASTTATGRRLLLYARHYAEKNIEGCKCVYGDSILGDEPILFRLADEMIHIDTIDSIANNNEWCQYPQFKLEDDTLINKEQSYPKMMQVYVQDRWVNVKRIIRHQTTKMIYRVITGNGSVDVTGDHSLIDDNGNMIKPTDCIIGNTKIKYSFPELSDVYKSCNTYYESESKLETQKMYMYMISCGVKPLVTYDARIRKYILKYDMFKPPIDDEIMKTIETVYPVRKTNPDEYVYDIETDCGWFTAGIGGMTLKNTDSIFVKFSDQDGNPLKGIEGLQESINKGISIEKGIQMYYKKPHKLEYEKTFWPFILFTKKRYVGHLYEKDVNKFKQKSMGIVLKRRDNAPIVKHVFGGVIKTIMIEKNIDKSVRFLRQTLTDLLDGKYDVNQLIISKTLKGYYKDPDSIAHKVLADRMAERDPGNKPQTNDRIPYVYIDVPEIEGMLQGDKIEHVDYVKEHKLTPNYLHYITNQIMKPVSQIYELIVEKLNGYNKGPEYFNNKYKRLLDNFEGDEEKAKKKVGELKRKEVFRLIFADIIASFINKKNGYMTLDQIFEFAEASNDKDDEEDGYDSEEDFRMEEYNMEVIKKRTKKKQQVCFIDFEPLDQHLYDDRIKNVITEKMGEVKVKKTMDLSQFFGNLQN